MAVKLAFPISICYIIDSMSEMHVPSLLLYWFQLLVSNWDRRWGRREKLHSVQLSCRCGQQTKATTQFIFADEVKDAVHVLVHDAEQSAQAKPARLTAKLYLVIQVAYVRSLSNHSHRYMIFTKLSSFVRIQMRCTFNCHIGLHRFVLAKRFMKIALFLLFEIVSTK